MQEDDDSDDMIGICKTRRSVLSGNAVIRRGIWGQDEDSSDDAALLLEDEPAGPVDIEDCRHTDASLRPAIKSNPAARSRKRVRIDETHNTNTTDSPTRKRAKGDPLPLSDGDLSFLDSLDADSFTTTISVGDSEPATPTPPYPKTETDVPASAFPSTPQNVDAVLDAHISVLDNDSDDEPPPRFTGTAVPTSPPTPTREEREAPPHDSIPPRVVPSTSTSTSTNEKTGKHSFLSKLKKNTSESETDAFDLFAAKPKPTPTPEPKPEPPLEKIEQTTEDDFYAEVEAAEKEDEAARGDLGVGSDGSGLMDGVFCFAEANAAAELREKQQQQRHTPHETASTAPAHYTATTTTQPNPLKEEGNRHLKLGNYLQAIQHYTEGLNETPPLEAHILFSNRSSAHLALQQYKKAFSDAVSCVLSKPLWFKGHLRKGLVLSALGYYPDALSELSRAAECCMLAKDSVNGASVEAQRKKVENGGDIVKADGAFFAAYLKEAKEGTQAYQQKDWTASIRHYSKALSVDKSSFVILSNRSAAFTQMKQTQEALADAAACLQLNPTHAKGYIRKANALKAMNLTNEAAEALKSGIASLTSARRDVSLLEKELAAY